MTSRERVFRALEFRRPDRPPRVRAALELPAGGMIAQCSWCRCAPAASIAAVYEAWATAVTSGE